MSIPLRAVLLLVTFVAFNIAHATGLPPKIIAVIPDYNPDGPDRLFIVGERLPGGPNLKVKLTEVQREESEALKKRIKDLEEELKIAKWTSKAHVQKDDVGSRRGF